jgi:hypothetical protein
VQSVLDKWIRRLEGLFEQDGDYVPEEASSYFDLSFRQREGRGKEFLLLCTDAHSRRPRI